MGGKSSFSRAQKRGGGATVLILSPEGERTKRFRPLFVTKLKLSKKYLKMNQINVIPGIE